MSILDFLKLFINIFGSKPMKDTVLTSFDEIIDITLEHEGGYVHDPKDLGGETNFGLQVDSILM